MSLFPQLAANSLIAAATYSLIALGFNLIYGTAKFINIAHGALAAIGGYASWYLLSAAGMPLWAAVILGVLAAGAMGVVLDQAVFAPLRRRKATNLVLFVASLGAFTVLQALLAILFTSQFQSLSPFWPSHQTYEIAGAAFSQVHVVMMGAALVIFLGILWMLKGTRFGKAVTAISDDEEVARIIGIPTGRIIGWVFFLSSALAGLAGILIGFDTGIQPTMGLEVLLKGAIASIIGGIGNIYGGVLGSLLLGAAENFGIWKIAGEWKSAIAFGVLIVFLVFRPKGIMNK